MMKKYVIAQKSSLLIVCLAIIVLFQNCNNNGFQVDDQSLVGGQSHSTLALSQLTITSPEVMSATKDSLLLVGTCSSGVPVQIKGDVQTLTTVECVNGQFQTSITLTQNDGSKNVMVFQSDSLGNSKADSRNFVKDTQAPSVGIMNVANNAIFSSSIQISGTCETGLPVSISISTINQNANCNQGMYLSTLNISSLSDGSLTLTISQTDKVNLVGSQTRNVVKDTVAPVVAISLPANNASVTSPMQLSGTCETGVDVVISGSGVASPLTLACTNSSFSSVMNLVSGTGSRVVTVTQTDVAGNVGTATRTYQATAPTTPPLATSITAPAANTVAKNGVTLQGACENGVAIVISGAGVAAQTNATCSSGSYSAAITFSSGDGAKVIQVQQTDNTGRAGLDTRSFVRDATPPVLTLSSPEANAEFQATALLVGSCETGRSISITGGVTTTTTISCVNGSFSTSINFSTGDGQKAITLTSTDAVSNTTTISRNFVRDSVAPVISLTSPDAGTSAATQITATGTCETGLSVVASGTGVKSSASQVCAGGAFSLNVVFSDNDGTKAISFSQTDKAGNIGKVDRSFMRQTPATVYDGSMLYGQNCAACHGALASSAKVGRTASQIQAAILNVPQMQSLVALTAPQVEAIANVLKGGGSVPNSQLWTCNANDEGTKEQISTRRLTANELISSYNVIFGSTIMSQTNITSKLSSLPTENFFGQHNPFDYRTKAVEGLLTVAEAIAETIVGNTSYTTSVLSCNLTTSLNTCKQNLLNNLGLKIFRRPLLDTEKTLYQNFMTDIGGTDGVKWALVRMLVSPEFTSVVEVSDSLPVGTRYKLSQYEIAARISFRITGATPDQTLLDAASKNELSQLAQVKAQAQRLLALPIAQERTKYMIRNWIDKQDVGDPHPDVAAALGVNPAGFGSEMMNEFNLFLDEIIFKKSGTYKDLLTNKTAFANTSRLAKLYGLTQSTAAQSFKDTRGGILLRGATLTSAKPWSDPIGRGVYMRRKILCQTIPFPSAQIVADREKELGQVNRLTTSNRTIVTNLTSSATCMSCHSVINPLGFSLEGFGPMGEVRSQEVIYGASGQVLASHALNLSVPDLAIDDGVITPSNTAEDLVRVISESTKAKSCFAQQVFAQSRYRFPASAGDGCAMNKIYEKLNNGLSIQEVLIENVANEDVFWRAFPN